MIDVAEETWGVCQSWVLDNDEPIYVQKIRQDNGGGWHHSNWFFVPETAYPPNPEVEGPDAALEGTWNCRDRNFREYLAAAAGDVLAKVEQVLPRRLSDRLARTALFVPSFGWSVPGSEQLADPLARRFQSSASLPTSLLHESTNSSMLLTIVSSVADTVTVTEEVLAPLSES